MNRFKVILSVLAGCLPTTACASDMAAPAVAATVIDVKVLRAESGLLRYVQFSTESDYPCVRIEVIQPTQAWRVSAQRDICEIEGSGGSPLSFAEDMAFIEFTEVSLKKAQLQFTVNYSPRFGSGEYRSRCVVRVEQSGTLEQPECSATTRF
ncbi:MAG: hypothetical protein CL583_04885 [Alteromonadaceae bacterium]|nr:hypothetical protein [Alteromonadaceae bacterium]